MKKQMWKYSALVTIILVAFLFVLRNGSTYWHSSYQQTNDFKEAYHEQKTVIEKQLLPNYTEAQWMTLIDVSEGDIEEYRHRYGMLDEQLDSIRERYETSIAQAEGQKADQLREEMEAKLADIERNFRDEEYVANKIKGERAKEIIREINETRTHSRYDLDDAILYQLTAIETGEEHTNLEPDETAANGEVFTKNKPFIVSVQNYVNMPHRLNGEGDEAVDPESNPFSLEQRFIGSIDLKEPLPETSAFYASSNQFRWNQLIYFSVIVLGIVSVGALMQQWKQHRLRSFESSNWLKRYEQIPLDFRIGLAVIVSFIALRIAEYHIGYSLYLYGRSFGYWELLWKLIHLSKNMLILWVLLYVLFSMLLTLIRQVYQEEWTLEEWKETMTARFFLSFRDAFLHRSIGVQMFILLIGFFLAGLGWVFVAYEPFLIIFYMMAVVFLGLPALYIFVRRFGYLNRVFKSTEKIAQGELTEIPIEGKSPIAKHAQHLNNLQEGVKISVTEQAKSERLKTELITNVSHDLRTPLTSIITYTDLLKQPNLSEEDRQKYVDVIDKKSERLKVLIEDLFEVSKMASGNMELHKTTLDVTQLVQQVLAERNEEFQQSNFEIVTRLPEQPIITRVDGERFWRVIDNLVSNALKYSLPGTRIYIDLEKEAHVARFVVRNISKYELDANVEELFERFKRGDKARNTEGSGLGLAIAQSIVDMHGGEMEITLDGDLFKVSVTLPLI
ncbi:sensor histidine kinase [Savagea faecisuis]|uniref:histidine kinase n=1 Tax=Savagea faecisuis TaxID=1274803 RepID=A0ABW3GYW2_9BACL